MTRTRDAQLHLLPDLTCRMLGLRIFAHRGQEFDIFVLRFLCVSILIIGAEAEPQRTREEIQSIGTGNTWLSLVQCHHPKGPNPRQVLLQADHSCQIPFKVLELFDLCQEHSLS